MTLKEIIEAMKAEIQQELPYLKGINILADADILPAGCRFPCVGIKDGPVVRTEGVGQVLKEEVTIFVYLYDQTLREEASLMGAPGKKGLLEMYEDLHAALEHNSLGIDGIIHAFCPEEYPSESMVMSGDVFVQRKGCKYVYEKRTAIQP